MIVGGPARSPAGRAVAEAWERRWFNQGVTLAADDAAAHVDSTWDKDIVPVLRDYIRIPNVSVAYDAGWAEAGHMARATELLRDWCQQRADDGLEGATVEVLELEGRTPLLLVDVPPAGAAPPTTPSCSTATSTSSRRSPAGRRPRPWGAGHRGRPPLRAGRRRRRLLDLRRHRRPRGRPGRWRGHARCVVLIEASEESEAARPPPRQPSATGSASRPRHRPRLVVAATGTTVDHHLAAGPRRATPSTSRS